jgi:three-Cys-motif partner protein
LAIESDPLSAGTLKDRVAALGQDSLCTVMACDCNHELAVRAVREISHDALSLMFVDLLGTEVRMETLRAMTADRQIDLVVTWPEMDVVRNRGQMLEQEDRWNGFFGTPAWKPLVRSLGPARRLRALQRLYVEELRRHGYQYTKYVGSVRNQKGHALYRPLFASKHPLGLDFWEKASATRAAQGTLFDT